MMICDNCRFYEPLNNDDHGYCKITHEEVYPEDECLYPDEEY